MALPNIQKSDVLNALIFIDKHGVPDKNMSTTYELVKDGKTYPPKYVIAVADHLTNGTDIATGSYNSIEAKNFLLGKGFEIQNKQEKYVLTITANNVVSTDERFTTANLGLGDNYKPLDVYYRRANGEVIHRKYNKGERRNSNQTMARIAFQIFERQIESLSIEERNNFPICQYTPSSETFRGIYSSIEEFRKYRNTLEYLTYRCDNDRLFVIYCWNVFSTILFAQECLKRFGETGDQFIFTYRDKDEQEAVKPDSDEILTEELAQQFRGYMNPYSSMLIESKNIILRGAPGTGKSYLAKEIAADIISNGYFDDYTLLSPADKERVEFVQFHPNYDYSDFVEGLRPTLNNDGSMGFRLQDGIFKRFVDRAKKNYENAKKPIETIEKEVSINEAIDKFFSTVELGITEFKTINGNAFYITSVDEKHIVISIPANPLINKLTLNIDDVRRMLESNANFEKIKDVTNFFGKQFAAQSDSYVYVLYKSIKAKIISKFHVTAKQEELKKYIFIIDEINRGEISKIFGELFFAIDPGYRGKAGEVSTQYSNLHSDPTEKFYIPDNVYIIGTMNDIDRSVDSFDFAMRRRFRFVELKADERLEMLSVLEDEELESEAIRRMLALNKEIAKDENLNENYQVGASYFLKLRSLSFDQLWTDYLKPLLQEYIQGIYDDISIMNRFEKAYGYSKPDLVNNNETV